MNEDFTTEPIRCLCGEEYTLEPDDAGDIQIGCDCGRTLVITVKAETWKLINIEEPRGNR